MDAYDLRMGTFAAKQHSPDQKKKNFERFIQEKRGFIRTSNGYNNSDPEKIVSEERPPAISKPGPALVTNFDNKYNLNSSYADDKGRYKIALKPNSHDAKVLKQAKKSTFLKNLKESNIKHYYDQMGSPDLTRKDSPKGSSGLDKHETSDYYP